MANETFTATQLTVLAIDTDGDGVIDPGEIVTTTVTITNNSTTPTPVNATGVQFTEDLQGMTLVNQAGDDINASIAGGTSTCEMSSEKFFNPFCAA